MTGKYPARLHLTEWIPGRKQWPTARLITPAFAQQLPLRQTTIAEALRNSAMPPGPRRHGFEFRAANECSHTPFNTPYFRDPPEPIPVRKFEAEAWTDLALRRSRLQTAGGRRYVKYREQFAAWRRTLVRR